jgi:hypothetical protein
LDDIIKIDIKGNIFVFGLVPSLQHVQSEIFGNVNEVNLHIKIIVFKILQLGLSDDAV